MSRLTLLLLAAAALSGPALAQALADGRIEACLLDGAESGFASRSSPLHAASNLYLTPRLGGYTRQALLRASWYVAHRVHEALTSAGGAGRSLTAPTGEPVSPSTTRQAD